MAKTRENIKAEINAKLNGMIIKELSISGQTLVSINNCFSALTVASAVMAIMFYPVIS